MVRHSSLSCACWWRPVLLLPLLLSARSLEALYGERCPAFCLASDVLVCLLSSAPLLLSALMLLLLMLPLVCTSVLLAK